MTQSSLFTVEPAVGELWNRPDDEHGPLEIKEVFVHDMYGVTWVWAERRKGDCYMTIGPLSSFLERGYVRVK